MPDKVVFCSKTLIERRYYPMNRITVSESDCKQETASVWLASTLQFCIDGGLLASFKAFKLNMKEIKYTVYQKLLTV